MKQLILITMIMTGFSAISQTTLKGKFDPIHELFLPEDSNYFTQFLNPDYSKLLHNGFIGIIDKKGKIVCPTLYDRIITQENDWAIVTKNDRFGLVNLMDGKESIPCIYQSIQHGYDQMFTAELKSEQFGVIDKLNKLIVPFKYFRLEYLFDELFKFKLKQTSNPGTDYPNPEQWGVINIQDSVLMKPIFNVIYKINAHYGLAERMVVDYDNGSADSSGTIKCINGSGIYFNAFGYTNETGIVTYYGCNRMKGIIPQSYFEEISRKRHLNQERLPQWVEAKTKPLIYLGEEPIKQVLTTGVVVTKNGKYGIRDFSGKLILPIEYDAIEENENGTWKVSQNGLEYLMDKKAKKINTN